MNMMNKIIEPAPFGGDLQIAVGRLAGILTPIDLGAGDVSAAQKSGGRLDRARDEAKGIYAAVCRRCGHDIAEANRRGYGEPAEVQTARRSVERAEARSVEARKAFNLAREKQGIAFLREVMPQINEAAPVLLEVIRLLNDLINPLRDLYGYTVSRELPQPRLLMSTPLMLEATRVLTAAINAATAPNPPPAESDDDD